MELNEGMDIYDLIYSHADNGYIAVPRLDSGKIGTNLSRFDSGPPSGYYACTKIPTSEILEVLQRHRTKWGASLTALRDEKKMAFHSHKVAKAS